MKVPLAKPSVGEEELAALRPVLDSGWLGMGATVGQFEVAIGTYLAAPHAIAVSSGTAAIQLALEAVDVRGREVIVPSMTFAATVQAILAAGGIPVFAECRAADLNLDVGDVVHRLTPRTRAIVPVHYRGVPVDMEPLLKLAGERGLVVVEDAAHAFGSHHEGRRIGSFGHLTCFSFDPIKVVTCGEGGAVATSNNEWAEKIRTMRVLGISKDTWDRYKRERPWHYAVVSHGYRYHMSNINAAIGLAQLPKCEAFITGRREVVRRYDSAFHDLPGVTLLKHQVDNYAPFCYTLRVTNGQRDAFMKAMNDAGIGVSVLYLPNHTQPAFAKYATPLPRTAGLCQEHVSLPLYNGMEDAAADHVIAQVRGFFRDR